MPVIRLSTEVAAPQPRCFDLARSVEFHVHSMARYSERAVGGVTSGLLSLHDEVKWCARHFWRTQGLVSRVTAFDPPHAFTDEQVTGAFKRFRHDHRFEALGPARTRITDNFDFESPLGPLGSIADWLVLTGYMRRMLTNHQAHLKAALESDAWKRFLTSER